MANQIMIWVEKYGEEEANIRQQEMNKKLSKSLKGRKFTEKHKERMRISAINNYIKNGRIIPNYNPTACKIIDEYGSKNGYNFQHAENGGEVCIGGYYPDGLDEDRKTIIEIDEAKHYKNGNLREKDVKRQKYLEDLGYKLIRIKL